MSDTNSKIAEVVKFYDSPEGRAFWKQNQDRRGLRWEDNVANLCLKASPPENVEEFESVIWKVGDILIDRGIVRFSA